MSDDTTTISSQCNNKITGLAPLSLTRCRRCRAKKDQLETYECTLVSEEFPWAMKINCSNPNHAEWIVCTLCPVQRNGMITREQLLRHKKKRHSKNSKKKAEKNLSGKTGNPTVPGNTNNISTNQPLHHDVPPMYDNSVEDNWNANSGLNFDIASEASNNYFEANAASCLNFDFGSEASNKYFEANHKTKSGAAYLCSYSQFHVEGMSTHLDSEEVSLDLKYACLCSQLPQGTRSLLAEVISGVIEKVSAECQPCKNPQRNNIRLTIPNTKELIRSRYMEGRHAIYPNLPIPPVQELKEHSYVSPIDVIKDILGHGLPFDLISQPQYLSGESPLVTRIGESQRANEIKLNANLLYSRNNDVIPLWIIEWSDDFAPTNSLRASKNSVWFKIITVAPPHDGLYPPHLYTYPIAMGPKGVDHEEVESKFKDDLEFLKSGALPPLYSYEKKGMVTIHAELFASLQDQPERRGLNHMMMGNGQYTSRFRHSADLLFASRIIPACDKCLVEHLLVPGSNTLVKNSCPHCIAWEMDYDTGRMDFLPGDNYPEEMIPHTGCLRPFIISYDTMKEAVLLTHDKLVNQEWSYKECEGYLRVNGLSTDSIKQVLDNALSELTYELTVRDKDTNPENFHIMEKEKNNHPECFSRWKFPAVWTRSYPLDQFIDVPMHLLFLGIQKTIMKRVTLWHSRRSAKSQFQKYAEGLLDPIYRMRLSWCKVLPYNGNKTGGWISETYLAMARLNKWFYGGIEKITHEDCVSDLDVLPASRWLRKHNVAWLRLRGLSTKGKAPELKKRVAHYLSLPNPPCVLDICHTPAKNVMLTTQSLTSMLAHLMSPEVTERSIQEADRRIKVFLTYFHKFDQEILQSFVPEKNIVADDFALGEAIDSSSDAGSDAGEVNSKERNRPGESSSAKVPKPTWIGTPNFMSLLNLPDAMRKFGPLHHLWEGKYQGEGFIPFAKKHMSTGLRGKWSTNTLTKILRDKAMVNVSRAQVNVFQFEEYDDAEYNPDGSMRLRDAIRPYRDHNRANSDFLNNRPLSGALLDDGTFALMLYGGTKCVPLNRLKHVICFHGMHYHTWSLSEHIENYGISAGRKISKACLFLPRFVITNDLCHKFQYTVVASDWSEIMPDASFELPPVPVWFENNGPSTGIHIDDVSSISCV